ncbi:MULTISPECIES: hypothetical protein [unclassified Bradyrhizobium]|uniref:hypothetical protein n=1 Tax=unclassified Bradyrhizobium TaxID=2631580 RepID=UPI0029169418|nr:MULTISPECIES: hypothetical protein [unclassified Bradyrhizobium]
MIFGKTKEEIFDACCGLAVRVESAREMSFSARAILLRPVAYGHRVAQKRCGDLPDAR